MRQPSQLIVVALIAAGSAGCGGGNEELARMGHSFATEQSRQNQRVSDSHVAVAQGSKLLVESDAKARRELIQLQQRLGQEQAAIGLQRDQLEVERRQLAEQRQTESFYGTFALTLSLTLACLAPLGLAGLALWSLHRGCTRQEVNDLLVEELAEALSQEPVTAKKIRNVQAPITPRLPASPHTRA